MTSPQTTPLVLRAASDGEGKALPLGLEGYPIEADGTPIFYRKMKIARAGKWTHRGTGEPVDIDHGRMDAWIANTRALSAAGVRPFLPGQHRAEFNAADNHGYLIDLARDGDDLYASVALYGDDARRVAATNGRSIYVVSNARDASGKVHSGESIAHVALVPNPALPDLGPTVRIAASAGGAAVEVPVLELNCGTGAGGFQQGNTCATGEGSRVNGKASSEPAGKTKGGKDPATMSATQINAEAAKLEKASSEVTDKMIAEGRGSERPSDWANKTDPLSLEAKRIGARLDALRAEAEARTGSRRLPMPTQRMFGARKKESVSLSGDSPMTEQQLDTIGEIIGADDVTDETAIDRLLAWSKQAKEKPAAAEAKVTALSADVKRLEKERDDAKADAQKALALSANAPKQPDAVTLAMYQDNIAAKRESAVKSGAISEAEAKEFDKLIADAQGQPTPLALSASTAGRPLAFALWDTIGRLSGTRNAVTSGNAVSRGNGGGLALSADNAPDATAAMAEARKEGEKYQQEMLRSRGLQPLSA